MGKRRARAAKAFQEAAELKKGKKKQEKKTGKGLKMAAETNKEKNKKWKIDCFTKSCSDFLFGI